MINVTCPACGETLDIPDDLLGGSVRCGNCRTVFTTPNTADSSIPTARPAGSSYDDQRRARRASRGVPIWVWLMLLLMGLGTCGCCGGFVYLMVSIMNPEFELYKSPDGRWEAQFPGPVIVSKRPTGRPNAETAVSSESKREIIGSLIESFFVYEVELTAEDRRKKPSVVADDLCQSLVLTEPGKIVFHRPGRSHQGHEAAEIAVEQKDGKHLVARSVVANNRGYVIGVIGPGKPGQSPWVDEFLDSFSIVDPKVEKQDEENVRPKPGKVEPEAAPKPNLDDGVKVAPAPRVDVETQTKLEKAPSPREKVK